MKKKKLKSGEKIFEKLFLKKAKNPPSLKKSYSGYNKMVYFNTFLIKKSKNEELRFKDAYKKKLYYEKL